MLEFSQVCYQARRVLKSDHFKFLIKLPLFIDYQRDSIDILQLVKRHRKGGIAWLIF